MILTPSCEQSRFSADVAGGCVRALGMITSEALADPARASQGSAKGTSRL